MNAATTTFARQNVSKPGRGQLKKSEETREMSTSNCGWCRWQTRWQQQQRTIAKRLRREHFDAQIPSIAKSKCWALKWLLLLYLCWCVLFGRASRPRWCGIPCVYLQVNPQHVLSKNHVQPYVESRGVQLFWWHWPCLEQDEAQKKHDLHTSTYLERIYTAYSENGLLVVVGIPGFGDLNLPSDIRMFFFSFPQFPLRYTYIGYISRLTVGLLHFQFPVQVDRLWTEALVASHTRPTRHNYLTRWVFHGRSARKWILSQLYKKMFGARRCKPCCAMLRCQTILEDEDLSQAWGCGGVKDLAWFRG